MSSVLDCSIIFYFQSHLSPKLFDKNVVGWCPITRTDTHHTNWSTIELQLTQSPQSFPFLYYAGIAQMNLKINCFSM